MALTSEIINSNNELLCENNNSVPKNHVEANLSPDFLLNWSPKDYYLNFEELKASERYKVIEEIEMSELYEDNSTNILKEQLLARDNIIFKLHQYFEKIFHISQQSQIQLKELTKKKKVLLKTIRLQKQKRTSKKLEKKETSTYEDKSIQTESKESYSYDWNLYYAQYCNQYYNGENNDENLTEMKTESVSSTAPETETFSDSVKGPVKISSDTEEKDVEDSKENCNKLVDYDLDAENLDAENITDTTPDSNWNTVDVKEEVRELATEITERLGYVFVKEFDMYYDHSSGYYYDHKTRLYYDGKTGTYFYYNYETGKYEFHSQVSPSASEEPSSTQAMKSDKDLSTIEKEEGECSDTEESAGKEIREPSPHSEDNIEVAPSLRLMVMNGEMKGSLHVVTVSGGIIGREGDLHVLLNHPSISKIHAEITYRSGGPDDHHYYLQDLGSANGTFLKGRRIGETRKFSCVAEIGHGWEVKFGDVVLCCHIHPGLLTCNECEPGLITVAVDKSKLDETVLVSECVREKLEKERRRQNKVIRKKFSINYFDPGPALNNSKYKDRAGVRREVVGSDNPYEKTEVASIDTNLPKTNKGFQLMEKMGWSEGQSLGVSDSGLTEPVVPVSQTGRMGLGCHGYSLDSDVNKHSIRQNEIKQRIMKNTKMNDSSSSESPSQNSEIIKGIQPIQFAPSSDSIT